MEHQVYGPSEPKLYASPETRAFLGPFAKDMARWAGMDVLAISSKDVVRYGGTAPAPTGTGVVFSTTQIVTGLSDTFGKVARGAGYDYRSPQPDRPDGDLARRQREAGALMTTIQAPSTVSIPAELNAPGAGRLCVISIPDRKSLTESLRDWTGLPNPSASFRVSSTQLLGFDMAHETGHCGQPIEKQGAQVTREAEADQHGLNMLREKMGDTPSFRNLGRELIDLRALEVFHFGDTDHATTPTLNLDGRPVDLSRIDPKVEEYDLATGNVTRLGPGSGDIIQVLDKVRGYVSEATGTGPFESLDLMRTDPRLVYESAKVLKAQGAFSGSDVQTAYVDQYLAAAERRGISQMAAIDHPRSYLPAGSDDLGQGNPDLGPYADPNRPRFAPAPSPVPAPAPAPRF